MERSAIRGGGAPPDGTGAWQNRSRISLRSIWATKLRSPLLELVHELGEVLLPERGAQVREVAMGLAGAGHDHVARILDLLDALFQRAELGRVGAIVAEIDRQQFRLDL